MRNQTFFRVSPMAARATLAAMTLAAGLLDGLVFAQLPAAHEQLVERSQAIAVAVVEEAYGRWNRQHTFIFTDAVLRIEESLRGEPPARIALSLPGGTIGGETHRISLSALLEPGERYLLFLRDLAPPALAATAGGRQGVIRETDAARFAGVVEAVRSLVMAVEEGVEPPQLAADPGLLAPVWDELAVRDPAIPPIAINVLPPDSPFSPHDQHQMAYWNAYAPDLFQVMPDATGSWAYGNGTFDIGFPDDAQVMEVLDGPWEEGYISFVASRAQNGHTIEADLALNPNLPWTLDQEEATRPAGPHSFRHTVLGYLGKAWGLETPFLDLVGDVDRESVLAPSYPQYKLATLFRDDTEAVRRTFSGPPIRDGLISSYSVRPGFLIPDILPAAPTPSSVRRGGRFDLLQPIKIENTGTVELVKPTVEVYLVPRRFSMEKAVLVKRLQLPGSVAPGALQEVAPGQIRLPRQVQPGVYYLAFRLADPRDGYQGNNIAWSDFNVTLTVRRR